MIECVNFILLYRIILLLFPLCKEEYMRVCCRQGKKDVYALQSWLIFSRPIISRSSVFQLILNLWSKIFTSLIMMRGRFFLSKGKQSIGIIFWSREEYFWKEKFRESMKNQPLRFWIARILLGSIFMITQQKDAKDLKQSYLKFQL